jgi:hypothetical protein
VGAGEQMTNENVILKTKDIEKKDFTHTGADFARRIWLVHHTDEGGYTSGDHTIHIWKDGSFTVSENDGDGFISLHGEIAEAAMTFFRSHI